MEKIRKLFFGINMTWPKVIISAVIIGIVVGVLMRFPALEGTSFQDPGTNLDCWFLFALIIILNCEKPLEAVLKCFVFFLISQPIIYLVQVPGSDMGFSLFMYYDYWFKMTLLTIPGAFIAYQVKRKDILSVLILSVATGYLAWAGVQYSITAFAEFPNHILSAIFCFATAIIYVLAFFDEKKMKLAALAVFAAVLIGSGIYGYTLIGDTYELPQGSWTYEVSQDDVVSVEMKGDSEVRFKPIENGNADVVFTNENGEKVEYLITVNKGRIYVQESVGGES